MFDLHITHLSEPLFPLDQLFALNGLKIVHLDAIPRTNTNIISILDNIIEVMRETEANWAICQSIRKSREKDRLRG